LKIKIMKIFMTKLMFHLNDNCNFNGKDK